jgi:hypothetical protein
MVYSLDLDKRFKKKFCPVVQKKISSVISNNKTYFAVPYDHFCNAFPGYISSIPLQKELIHQMARNNERSKLKAFWVIFASTQALTSDEFAQDTATLFGDSTSNAIYKHHYQIKHQTRQVTSTQTPAAPFFNSFSK